MFAPLQPNASYASRQRAVGSGLPGALTPDYEFLWCITIIGIPFSKQFFKIAKLSLVPFGARFIRK